MPTLLPHLSLKCSQRLLGIFQNTTRKRAQRIPNPTWASFKWRKCNLFSYHSRNERKFVCELNFFLLFFFAKLFITIMNHFPLVKMSISGASLTPPNILCSTSMLGNLGSNPDRNFSAPCFVEAHSHLVWYCDVSSNQWRHCEQRKNDRSVKMIWMLVMLMLPTT